MSTRILFEYISPDLDIPLSDMNLYEDILITIKDSKPISNGTEGEIFDYKHGLIVKKYKFVLEYHLLYELDSLIALKNIKNVIHLQGFFYTDDGFVYLLFEKLKSINKLSDTNLLDLRKILNILEQLCISYKDIHKGNLMLDKDGNLVLIDFGWIYFNTIIYDKININMDTYTPYVTVPINSYTSFIKEYLGYDTCLNFLKKYTPQHLHKYLSPNNYQEIPGFINTINEVLVDLEIPSISYNLTYARRLKKFVDLLNFNIQCSSKKPYKQVIYYIMIIDILLRMDIEPEDSDIILMSNIVNNCFISPTNVVINEKYLQILTHIDFQILNKNIIPLITKFIYLQNSDSDCFDYLNKVLTGPINKEKIRNCMNTIPELEELQDLYVMENLENIKHTLENDILFFLTPMNSWDSIIVGT